MNLRPIEPGCLAIVLTGNPEFAGMTVSVIERASDACHTMPNGVTTVGGHDKWVIETPRPVPVQMFGGETQMVTMGAVPERVLMRIDGGELIDQEQEEEVAV